MARQTVLLLMCFSVCFRVGLSTKSYELRRYCDRVLSLVDNGVKSAEVYYTHKSRIRDHILDMDCTFQISGWTEQDLAFQFTAFDISSAKTTVELRQGDSWSRGETIPGLPRRFSTFHNFGNVYVTQWWRLFIRIKGEPPKDGARLFTMKLNVFHRGACYSWEHRCDNGRCVDKDLTCKGDNPCGDESDCREGVASQTMIIVVVSCVSSFFLLVAVTCKVLIYCCNKSEKRQRDLRERDRRTNPDGTDQALTLIQDNSNNTNISHGPANYTTLHVSGIPENGDELYIEGEPPPPYTSVISSDLGEDLSENSDSNSDASTDGNDSPAPPDYHTAVSEDHGEVESPGDNRRRRKRPRRPARRHSSRYLPRYSQVVRNRDNYEVRGEDESVS